MEKKNNTMKKIGTTLVAMMIVFFTGMKVIATDNKKEEKTNEPQQSQKYKDNIVVALKADAKTLDPQRTIDTTSNKTIKLIFNGLVTFDKDLNIIPCLAERWEKIDDLNTVFYLKKGVKFHNGGELKAEDVKFTLDRARVSNQSS